MPEREIAIKVRNLTARYGDNLVLNDISFDVYKGEVFVVLGGSGCGKSTLLTHMIGLREPESGEVWYDDINMVTAEENVRDELRKDFGVLFQSGALFKSMTLAYNVGLPLREFTDLSNDMVRDLVRLKLGKVGLAGLEHLFPDEMSGGMQKRGGLARAMVLDPSILFFDEPGAGLDPITSVELDNLMVGINKGLHTTMVVVTHELESIFKIADRVIMLDKDAKGIVADGNPEDLKNNSDNPKVRAFFNRETFADDR